VREIFIDTNVLIDYVLEREPYFTYAEELFILTEKKSIVLNISAISYNNVYYIVRKRLGREKAKMVIKWISDITKCIPVDCNVIKQSMVSQFKDFEDAIQYNCALQVPQCEAIITRNVKDFKLSDIPVIYPETYWVNEILK
jgi:predicted nucleic acid-binding protein